jgi:hypothetical protein
MRAACVRARQAIVVRGRFEVVRKTPESVSSVRNPLESVRSLSFSCSGLFGFLRANPLVIEAAVSRQPNNEDWINDARRRLAEWRMKKPDTKAGQIRALWPEIREALGQGRTLRSLRDWLEQEAGVAVTIDVLGVYVRRFRAKDGDPLERTITDGNQAPILASLLPRAIPSKKDQPQSPHDPMANAREALNKPRFDIRKAHSDGDPSGRKLI